MSQPELPAVPRRPTKKKFDIDDTAASESQSIPSPPVIPASRPSRGLPRKSDVEDAPRVPKERPTRRHTEGFEAHIEARHKSNPAVDIPPRPNHKAQNLGQTRSEDSLIDAKGYTKPTGLQRSNTTELNELVDGTNKELEEIEKLMLKNSFKSTSMSSHPFFNKSKNGVSHLNESNPTTKASEMLQAEDEHQSPKLDNSDSLNQKIDNPISPSDEERSTHAENVSLEDTVDDIETKSNSFNASNKAINHNSRSYADDDLICDTEDYRAVTEEPDSTIQIHKLSSRDDIREPLSIKENKTEAEDAANSQNSQMILNEESELHEYNKSSDESLKRDILEENIELLDETREASNLDVLEEKCDIVRHQETVPVSASNKEVRDSIHDNIRGETRDNALLSDNDVEQPVSTPDQLKEIPAEIKPYNDVLTGSDIANDANLESTSVSREDINSQGRNGSPTLLENRPKKRGPPPVPKKPSSRIAAFQELLEKQQKEQFSKIEKPSTSKSSTASNETANSSKTAFQIAKEKMQGGFIPLPGMNVGSSLPPALAKINSKNDGAENIDKTAEKKANIHQRRAKGPRGRKLPANLTNLEKPSNDINPDNIEIIHNFSFTLMLNTKTSTSLNEKPMPTNTEQENDTKPRNSIDPEPGNGEHQDNQKILLDDLEDLEEKIEYREEEQEQKNDKIEDFEEHEINNPGTSIEMKDSTDISSRDSLELSGNVTAIPNITEIATDALPMNRDSKGESILKEQNDA